MNYPEIVVPDQPNVSVNFTTATSISLSLRFPSDSVVDRYEVMWISHECPDDVDEGSTTISDINYIIEGLREGTSYTITVSATNSAGTSHSVSVAEETMELGNSIRVKSIQCSVQFQILARDYSEFD